MQAEWTFKTRHVLLYQWALDAADLAKLGNVEAPTRGVIATVEPVEILKPDADIRHNDAEHWNALDIDKTVGIWGP